MINLNAPADTMVEDNDLTLTATFEEGDHCAHCGDSIAEYSTGWEHNTTGAVWCNDLTDDEAADQDDATVAEPAPSLPGNWAGITTDESDESVRVEISVGDPRGCFTMTLRRVRSDDGDRLVLHVPHPDDSTPHAVLREIAPGTYQIGG